MEQTLAVKLSLKLREARQENGFSQERLAEEANLHRTYVGEIERGQANPSLEAVEKLAQALNISACEILGCEPVVRRG